jgi:hypothetical protein
MRWIMLGAGFIRSRQMSAMGRGRPAGLGGKRTSERAGLMQLEFECETYCCFTRPAGASVELGIRRKGGLSRLHFEEAKPDRHARSDVLINDNAALSHYGSRWLCVLDQPNSDYRVIE